MACIKLKDVGVEFAIYNAHSRSIKNRVLNVATGGKIEHQDGGIVRVQALRGINLKIGNGERVGLVGHNGAGKTTMLRLLSKIYRPTSGSLTILGEPTSLINISLGIDPEATGRENIRLRGAMMGMSKNEIQGHMAAIANFADLGDFLDLPLRTYSSGMQLRLAFAVSTTVHPEILIMDEWLSAGDENFAHKADARLREVVDSTKILILASHSQELLRRNCTRLIWMEHGTIKMDGEFDDVAPHYFGSSVA